MALSNDFYTGRKSGIANVAVQLTTTWVKAERGVQIYADVDNPAALYVGNVGVTADSSDSTDGFKLTPDSSILIPTRTPSGIYIIGASGTGKAWWAIV